MTPFEEIPNPFEEVPYKPPKRKTPLRKRTVKLIWFRMGPERDYPLYLRKAYKKARHKRKSERLAPGYWDSYVKGNLYQPCPPPPKGVKA